jgi:hypothetical protein
MTFISAAFKTPCTLRVASTAIPPVTATANTFLVIGASPLFNERKQI